jgi:hypothetical protein
LPWVKGLLDHKEGMRMPTPIRLVLWKYGITKTLTVKETIDLLWYDINLGLSQR